MSSAAIVNSLKEITIVHQIDHQGRVWGTSKRRLMCCEGNTWQEIAKLPYADFRDWWSWSRPTTRIFRSDKCNVHFNQLGTIIAIRAHRVYRLDPATKQFIELGKISGDSVLHRGIAEDDEGCFYFGEYFRNIERTSVKIYRVDPLGQTIDVAYEFPAKSIRHIHGVFRDPFEPAALWIAVGDYAGECYIIRTDKTFQKLERFGDGTQKWRAVSLYFTPTHVSWLTDSHIEQNYACRMSRETHELEIGQKIDAPAWYGTTCTNGMSVAMTTVEKGAGVKTDHAQVLISENAFDWSECFSFKKDAWRPMRLFKYGVLSCPAGNCDAANFYLSGEGLVGLDGQSCILKINR